MLEIVNQLDGFEARGNVKILMATNRPDTLDPVRHMCSNNNSNSDREVTEKKQTRMSTDRADMLDPVRSMRHR